MAIVRPPTSRVQIGYTQSGQRVWISTQLFDILREILDRIGGEGDAIVLTNIGAASSTDNAVVRFSGTTGDTIQNSAVIVDDDGNVTIPTGKTVDGRDLSADGSKLDGIEAGAEANDVDSVFGRTGAVAAQTSDYDASQIDNDSGVSGATVDVALDNLDSAKPDTASGTFTPVLQGSTTAGSHSYSTQAGDYRVIGDLVYISGRIVLSSYDTNAAGNTEISGLPFSEALGNNPTIATEITLTGGTPSDWAAWSPALIPGSGSTLRLRYTPTDGDTTNIAIGDIGGNSLIIQFAGVYAKA